MAKLTIIPTPIGNLRDITLRALDALRSADLILAEDTRTSAVLLREYDIHRPMQSHHKYNEHRSVLAIAERILGGEEIALISDAGTPGVSDPGFMLVRECVRLGVEVDCLPGATALVPALIMSGLPSDRFVFEGFLPLKKGLQTRLSALAQEERTVLIYESPHRLCKTLAKLIEHCGGDRPAVVCRELSKLHQEAMRDSLDGLLAYYTEHPPKGEIVLVLSGKPSKRLIRKMSSGDDEQEDRVPCGQTNQ